MTFDPFRPTREPWRSIYDAFQAEATQRHGRSVTEWIAAEEQAVLSAATQVAKKWGGRHLTLTWFDARRPTPGVLLTMH